MAKLELMHDAGNDVHQHVIFIHGLNGDLVDTWQSSSNNPEFWPNWLGYDLVGVSIWTIGYKADKSCWFSGKAMHLADQGVNTLETIIKDSRLQRGELVFVGHSLGGLLIKQLLRVAENQSLNRDEVLSFTKRVRKVVFLATPHSGSSLPFKNKLLQIFFRPSLVTNNLVKNDPNLRDLNNWYRSWSAAHGIEHLVLMESEPSWLAGMIKKMIVDPDSADPGLSKQAIMVDADHYSICKPDNRDSEIYNYIKNLVCKKIHLVHRETFIEKKMEMVEGKIDRGFNNLTGQLAEQPEKIVGLISNYINSNALLQSELLNVEIEKRLSIIQKSRFFVGFPILDSVNRLADEIITGNLSGGSSAIKCRALAWCSRLQSSNKPIENSMACYQKAKELGEAEEVYVAEAFIFAAENKLQMALTRLMEKPSAFRYSAAFMIMNNYKDAKSALEWMNDASITFLDFDSDGKISFLNTLFNTQQWGLAFENAKTIGNVELQSSPVLMYLSAMAYLLMVVPFELRKCVFRQIPLDPKNYFLSSDTESLKLRKKAKELFSECEAGAKKLGYDDAANFASDYALWLELLDPDSTKSGKLKLENSMCSDSEVVLRRFPIAFSFGINLNIKAIESEVDKQTARTMGGSRIASIARFVLAISKQEPNKVLQYIAMHRQQLNSFVSKESLYSLEIEMLAKCGLIQEAEKFLEEAGEKELSTSAREQLKNIIASARGDDPLELYISQYERTFDICDLLHLVNFLENTLHFKQFHEYAKVLFERTTSILDAERLSRAKMQLGKYSDLYQFLNENSDLIVQSKTLRLYWAWALFRKGKLTDCKNELTKLKNGIKNLNIRMLEVNVAISSGDWESLLPYIDNEWNKREERSAKELLYAGQLAKAIQPKRAKDLIIAATKKAKDDPDVLAAAYLAATSMGWESEPGVFSWLDEAKKLSDENGPIQIVSFEELSRQIPDQKERSSKIRKALNKEEIPIFVAAHLLNQSLADFYLFPALANCNEVDVRRRISIPAFNNKYSEFPVEGEIISIDITALLTLGYLKILDTVFDNFKKVILPHSTMEWLFVEKQKAAFHQPSKIEEAQYLERMLVDNIIKVAGSDQIVDAEIALEVGGELAFLLQEATKSSNNEVRQKLVVRSYPVHKLGSFMNEVADLTKYTNKLCNCSAIVRKFRECGALTEEEEQDALRYLFQYEKEWPVNLDIQDNAILYLDSLSVTFLQVTGVLKKVGLTKMEVYIHQDEVDRNKALRNHGSAIVAVNSLLESMREALANAIKSGKADLADVPDQDQKGKNEELHLMKEMFLAAQKSDACIIDDRFLNRHKKITHASGETPLHTTLDLLGFLVYRGAITTNQRISYHALLRRAGYIFIPLLQEELHYYLEKAPIVDGRLRETAELKSIRESLLQLKLSHLVMLPRDAGWLTETLRSVSHCLKSQWVKGSQEAICVARSDWLLQLIDYQGWAHCFESGAGINLAQSGAAMRINLLLLRPEKANRENQDQYWQWLEKKVIEPLKHEDPVSYNCLLKLVIDQIFSVGSRDEC